MSKINIEHLAKLSAISLDENEIKQMEKETELLLEFVWRLQSINTEWVEKMYTPVENHKLNIDRNTNTKVNNEELIKNSPNEVENNMIIIKSSTVEH